MFWGILAVTSWRSEVGWIAEYCAVAQAPPPSPACRANLFRRHTSTKTALCKDIYSSCLQNDESQATCRYLLDKLPLTARPHQPPMVLSSPLNSAIIPFSVMLCTDMCPGTIGFLAATTFKLTLNPLPVSGLSAKVLNSSQILPSVAMACPGSPEA